MTVNLPVSAVDRIWPDSYGWAMSTGAIPADVAGRRRHAMRSAVRLQALAYLAEMALDELAELAAHDPDEAAADHFVAGTRLLASALASLTEAFPTVAHGAQLLGQPATVHATDRATGHTGQPSTGHANGHSAT